MPCPLPRSLAAGPGRRPAAWPQHAGQEATQGPARRLRGSCRSLLAPWLRSPQLMPLGRGQVQSGRGWPWVSSVRRSWRSLGGGRPARAGREGATWRLGHEREVRSRSPMTGRPRGAASRASRGRSAGGFCRPASSPCRTGRPRTRWRPLRGGIGAPRGPSVPGASDSEWPLQLWLRPHMCVSPRPEADPGNGYNTLDDQLQRRGNGRRPATSRSSDSRLPGPPSPSRSLRRLQRPGRCPVR